MNSSTQHELALLEALTRDDQPTQRRLSAKLGMALGLTNIYLKRMVRKGYVKCVHVRPNRLAYLITPSGVAHKARLTYEFMEYSIRLYRDARARLREVLEPIVREGTVRVAIFGTGEAAELAYLCLKELGVTPAAVFSDEGVESFLNLPVRPLAEHAATPWDVLVVASLDNRPDLADRLEAAGIPSDKLVLLREHGEASAA